MLINYVGRKSPVLVNVCPSLGGQNCRGRRFCEDIYNVSSGGTIGRTNGKVTELGQRIDPLQNKFSVEMGKNGWTWN